MICVKMHRGTSEIFDADRYSDSIPKQHGVVLLTDVNRLAYRDSLEPTGWGFVDGELISSDENSEFDLGEFTFGLNTQVRCDDGMVLFRGCQIIVTGANQLIAISLVFHQK